MLSLEPLEIRFMQDSISKNFRTENFVNRKTYSVNDSIDSILSGALDYKDFPNITVSFINGNYYSHGNRRLYMFRVLQLEGKLQVIDVHFSECYNPNKFTTKNGGLSVRVRGATTKPHTRTSSPTLLPTQQSVGQPAAGYGQCSSNPTASTPSPTVNYSASDFPQSSYHQQRPSPSLSHHMTSRSVGQPTAGYGQFSSSYLSASTPSQMVNYSPGGLPQSPYYQQHPLPSPSQSMIGNFRLSAAGYRQLSHRTVPRTSQMVNSSVYGSSVQNSLYQQRPFSSQSQCMTGDSSYRSDPVHAFVAWKKATMYPPQ